MPITEAQARRALRHADIPWDSEVDDPRDGAWVVHDHHGLPGGLAAAFSIGCRGLRRAEDFFTDLGLGARRALRLDRGKPCDTTPYRLLAEQSPSGLEETLFAQVKDLVARKVVKNDLLSLGVVSFDGKGAWSRVDGEKMPGAVQSATGVGGTQPRPARIGSGQDPLRITGWAALRETLLMTVASAFSGRTASRVPLGPQYRTRNRGCSSHPP